MPGSSSAPEPLKRIGDTLEFQAICLELCNVSLVKIQVLCFNRVMDLSVGYNFEGVFWTD